MKKIITLLFAISTISSFLFGQYNNEWSIGTTWWDIQTTRAMQDRVYVFDDGTIGAVFNMGLDLPVPDDRKIGYNYFDGSAWGPEPFQSITSGEAINPSYTKFGENGEIVASEGNNGLYINYRINKGTGPWQEVSMPGPAGYQRLYSPQIVTSGTDNQNIHLFSMYKDNSQNLQYQDNIGKVIYSRSTDGGLTWYPEYYEFEFNDDYFGFSELSIVAANPVNETIAFVVGDYFTDLILMKSTDSGENWQKTIIVDHPYPYLEFGTTVTDTFWTHTGSMDVTLDEDGLAHVTFSLCHIASDTSTIWYYDYDSDGIVYWNENMETFSNNINALNPYDHPDSELIEDYNLIGWAQDINGNGELDFLTDEYPLYPSLGRSTMPTITITEWGNIVVIWSALTETYNNGIDDYRHLWARAKISDNWGMFVDLTSDLIHIFDECVFPVLAPANNFNYFHLIYEFDVEPGPAAETGEKDYTENTISYMKVELEPIPTPYAIAQFGADNTEIIEGDTVHFNNNSMGYPYEELTYEWEFEGGTPETSTEKNPAVIYSIAGLYDVTLTATVGGPYTDVLLKEEFISVSDDTGLEYRNCDNSLQIHPNPTQGISYLEFSSNDYNSYEIRDILGKRVLSGLIGQNTKSVKIDLSGKNEGIYFVSLTGPQDSYIKKLIMSR